MRVPRLPLDAHLLAAPGTVCDDRCMHGAFYLLQLPTFVCVAPACVCVFRQTAFPFARSSYHHLFPIAAFEELAAEALLARVVAGGSSTSTASGIGGDGSQQTLQGNGRGAPSSSAGAAGDRQGSMGAGAAAGGRQLLCCFGCLRDLTRAVDAACLAQKGGGGEGDAAATPPSTAKSAAVPMVLRCPACSSLFCYECDVYVHESLHNCPGCEVRGAGVGAVPDSGLT